MLQNKLKISEYDTEIWSAIKQENKRQEENIELIASENYASKIVMEAQGSILTNKYAEGYPKKRYYAGCKYIDIIEQIAIKRAKKLFNADFANVQPHSGSQANASVYMALMNPGETILGMNLYDGGHLTHGSSVNFSGKFYKFVNYGVDKNEQINYKKILNKAIKYKPKIIVSGFSSYSLNINWKKMRQIANQTNSYLLVDMAHIAGLVAAKLISNPINYAHIVTSTTHKTLSGPRGGLILAKNGNRDFYKKINSAVFPGIQGGPLMHVIAGKAIAFKEAMEPKFKKYQKQILKNSKTMSNIFKKNNFKIVSNTTENHLFLIDLRKKFITGKQAEHALKKANIIVNKNVIPCDSRNPIFTSGIRIGSPAITRRGMREKESSDLAQWICDILNDINNQKTIKNVKKKVISICKKFPVYKKTTKK